MPKPSSVLGWNPPDGPTTVVEPSSIKKLLGWLAGERPPAQFFNWFWKKVSQWVDYLNGLETESLTWTAAHSFQQPITLGLAIVGALADALVQRASFAMASSSVAPRTLLWSTTIPGILGSFSRLRFYATNSGDVSIGWELVHNASYVSGTGWVRSVAGQAATIFKVTQTGAVIIARRPAGASSWTDTYDGAGWSETIVAFAGAGSPASINGNLGLVGNLVQVGNYGVTGNISCIGEVDASAGLYRAEHRANLNGYTGGAGSTYLNFDDNESLTGGLRRKLYRLRDGKVTGIHVLLSNTVAEDLTIHVNLDGGAGICSLLVPAGQTAVFDASFSAAYTAGHYLGVQVSTAGGASVDAVNLLVVLGTKE